MSLSDGTYQIFNADVTTPGGQRLYAARSGNHLIARSFNSDFIEVRKTGDEKYTLKLTRGGLFIGQNGGQFSFTTRAYEWRIWQINPDKWKIVATAEDLTWSIPQGGDNPSRIQLLPQQGLPGQFWTFA